MRAYILETGEIALVLTKLEAEKITDSQTNNPVDCNEIRSAMGWVKAALNPKKRD